MNKQKIIQNVTTVVAVAALITAGVALYNTWADSQRFSIVERRIGENTTSSIMHEEEDRVTRIQFKQFDERIKELQQQNADLALRVEELEKKKGKK